MINPQAGRQKAAVEWMRWIAIGFGLKALAFFLKRQGKKDPLLGRALAEFNGVYRFESGDRRFARYLVLEGGKVFAGKNRAGEPDFKLTIFDPSKLSLRGRQEMVLEIIIGNKIGQTGNLFYLYQFGFILSLLDRSFKRKKSKRGLP